MAVTIPSADCSAIDLKLTIPSSILLINISPASAAYALNLSEAEVKEVFKKSAISKKVRKAALRGGEYLDRLDVNDIEEK
jgi:hypothetical protein